MIQAQYDYSYDRTCFREAGHAVMAFAFDYVVTEIASRPEPRVLARPPVDLRSVTDPALLKARYQADVLVNLAPIVGSAIHRDIHGSLDAAEKNPETSTEAEKAHHLLGTFGQHSKECLEEYISYASYILKQDPYLAHVKQIAALLHRENTLVAAEISRFDDETPKLDILDVAEVIDELLPATYRNLYPALLARD